MAMSFEQFVEATGAELVCGNIIVGIQSTRRIVGSMMDGTFQLNEEGHALREQLEAATQEKPAARRKKAETTEPDAGADDAAKA
ncbi:MAG: hypothetical protein ABFD96_15865 [Armatimonadia bacterium]